jgi:hypothetical protein
MILTVCVRHSLTYQLWTGTGRVPDNICCRMTPQTHSIRPCNICIRRFSTKERQCHLYVIEQSTAGQASSGTRAKRRMSLQALCGGEAGFSS